MPASWDDDLVKTSDETIFPPARRTPAGLWLIAAVLIIAAAAAAFVLFRGTSVTEPTTSSQKTPAADSAAAASRPLGAAAAPVDLPPLGESDDMVRTLVRQLSTHPQVAAWLATNGLIRNFTVVVANIAEGKAPAGMLRTLKPAAPFDVTDAGGQLQINPRSYERYAGLAQAVTSIDPEGSARLYTVLKPRLEEAYAELGDPGSSFDRVLERAIVQVLETPIPDGPVRIQPKGATGYAYSDSLLEALPAAQKQLLRMGPQNARVIQEKLRAIALALNIPADRLPPID